MIDPIEKRTFDWLMMVQTSLTGITTIIMTAGIPWAYMIGNKVSVIEATSVASAETMKDFRMNVNELRVTHSDGFRDHERRISGLETELAIIKQLAADARKSKQ